MNRVDEFNGSKECVKCGAVVDNRCVYATSRVLTTFTEPEKLSWECNRCGYKWITKTKDAINSSGATEE